MFFKSFSIILILIFACGAAAVADTPGADSCESQYPGDVNNNGQIELDDIEYLILYLQSAYTPPVTANADVNGDGCVDPDDVYYLEAYLTDTGEAPVTCTCVEPPMCPDSCDIPLCGDANGDDALNVGDWVYVVQYLFYGGLPPVRQSNGDFNSDCRIDIMDAIHLMCTFPWEKNWWPCDCNCMWPPRTEDRICMPGDANGDGQINVGDPVYLITFVFMKGNQPTPFALLSGDANMDLHCNIGDAVYLINYIFHGGPHPAGCGDWLYNGGLYCIDPDGNPYYPY